MTQEEKDLLLIDLGARLPYGVQVFVEHDKYTQATLLGVDIKQFSIIFGGNNWSSISNIEGHRIEQYKQLIKPYLRPMSSMTEEEKSDLEAYSKQELDKYADDVLNHADKDTVRSSHIALIYKDIDWYNKKYFDYRGLIPMGLALEAPEDMYNL